MHDVTHNCAGNTRVSLERCSRLIRVKKQFAWGFVLKCLLFIKLCNINRLLRALHADHPGSKS